MHHTFNQNKTKVLEMNNKGQLNILWFIYFQREWEVCEKATKELFWWGWVFEVQSSICEVHFNILIGINWFSLKITFFVYVKFKFIFVLVCMSSLPMCSTSFLAPMCLFLCFSLCFFNTHHHPSSFSSFNPTFIIVPYICYPFQHPFPPTSRPKVIRHLLTPLPLILSPFANHQNGHKQESDKFVPNDVKNIQVSPILRPIHPISMLLLYFIFGIEPWNQIYFQSLQHGMIHRCK